MKKKSIGLLFETDLTQLIRNTLIQLIKVIITKFSNNMPLSDTSLSYFKWNVYYSIYLWKACLRHPKFSRSLFTTNSYWLRSELVMRYLCSKAVRSLFPSIWIYIEKQINCTYCNCSLYSFQNRGLRFILLTPQKFANFSLNILKIHFLREQKECMQVNN